MSVSSASGPYSVVFSPTQQNVRVEVLQCFLIRILSLNQRAAANRIVKVCAIGKPVHGRVETLVAVGLRQISENPLLIVDSVSRNPVKLFDLRLLC